MKPGRYTLEVVRVGSVNDEYWLRLRVVEGDRVGYEFLDYCKRDESTLYVVEGTKTWNIFRACLVDSHMMMDFLVAKRIYFGIDELDELEGRGFTAEVATSKVDGSNYVRYLTVETLKYPGCGKARSESKDLIRSVMKDIAGLPSV